MQAASNKLKNGMTVVRILGCTKKMKGDAHENNEPLWTIRTFLGAVFLGAAAFLTLVFAFLGAVDFLVAYTNVAKNENARNDTTEQQWMVRRDSPH
jgi:hypothetical protein